jgi:hypothetical protein
LMVRTHLDHVVWGKNDTNGRQFSLVTDIHFPPKKIQ